MSQFYMQSNVNVCTLLCILYLLFSAFIIEEGSLEMGYFDDLDNILNMKKKS
jgi:hypothetical protein